MSKIMEQILQFFALGIFAVVVLFSAPFLLLSIFFKKEDEARVATTQGFYMRILNSETIWGFIALVAWLSFAAMLHWS
jgi:hypothetical protein